MDAAIGFAEVFSLFSLSATVSNVGCRMRSLCACHVILLILALSCQEMVECLFPCSCSTIVCIYSNASFLGAYFRLGSFVAAKV